MAKLENLQLKILSSSTRYCSNCKKEYRYNNFIQNYPKPSHEIISKVWKNLEIRFYCQYCYFLKIIKEIKKIKKLDS